MKRFFLLLSVLLMLLSILTYPCFALESNTAKLIDRLSDGDSANLEVNTNDGDFALEGHDMKACISNDDTSELSVQFESEYDNTNYHMNLELPVDDDSRIVIQNDNIITDADNYTVALEGFEGTIQINFIIENKDAPERYPIKYDLPDGFSFRFAEFNGIKDGSIEILNNENIPVSAIAIPWAKDSNGNSLETYYEIDGNTLYQIVKHQNIECHYPIVADPKTKYSDWFNSAKWIVRDGKYSLSIEPTNWNRQSGVAYMSTSWELLKEKKSDSSHWYNTKGLKNQYYCHTQFAKFKDYWNIESWRPVVSLAETIASGCNPT